MFMKLSILQRQIDNKQIIDFYLKNFSALDVFSDYFVDKMSDIIDHQLPGKLIQIGKEI